MREQRRMKYGQTDNGGRIDVSSVYPPSSCNDEETSEVPAKNR